MSLETCPLHTSPVQTIGPQLVPVHSQPRYQSSIEDRPSLKRQATAPLLSRPEKVAKTSKDKIDDSNVPDYSTDIHLAFLEALDSHPLTTTWKSERSFSDSDDNHFYSIIQEFILKKTGIPHSFSEISERLSVALSTMSITKSNFDPTILVNPDREDSHSLSSESIYLKSPPSYISQLYGDPIPLAKNSPSQLSYEVNKQGTPIKLIIEIPPTPSSVIHNDTNLTGKSICSIASPYVTPVTSFRLVSTPISLPCTPVEHGRGAPLEPPRIVHCKNLSSSTEDRWIPTPTEGILPELELPLTAEPSCTLVTSTQRLRNKDKIACPSDKKQLSTSRPRLSVRSSSWLSTSQLKRSPNSSSGSLASPFALGEDVSFASFSIN